MDHVNILKYKIVLSPEFSYEATNIYNHLIYNFNKPELAKKLRRKITNALSSLQFFPGRYLNLNNFIKTKTQNLHKILIDNYVLIYKIDYILHEVNILHIFHSNQDYLNLL